ncbi:MAG: PSD1 and planctomycete cytochrome C domain-containing protein [Verrucomicrobiales bacterium]|nr:PSD1 and planctomycete cytochrome C domain-containing protein [Verrucomicrobiales bacterium]
MTSIRSLGLLLAFLVSMEVGLAVDFNREIRPILSDKCFFCHGPDSHERKADLRLDTAEGAFADLGGYAAIVPGDLEKSELIVRILSQDPDDLMPPPDSHKSLTSEEIALLERWVEEGAQYEVPWAYQKPKVSKPPVVQDKNWPANWIDHFVLSRLENEGIAPSPPADDVTLLRRLHFDLLGLPPTPEDVAEFRNDKRDREVVWTDWVDRLLASPHFAERIAVYWLDLVRYADTVGYHGDQTHNISPYRDYVIRSFHQNLPFDQFTREQLAGDLLPNPDKWQKVASGYNRLLQTSHEGGIQAKEYNAIYAADRVRNLSSVWMGATVGCAQCHDHKYDPITIRDHYALAAFFADIHDSGFSGNSLPSNRPPEMLFFDDATERVVKEVKAKIASFLTEKQASDLRRWQAELAKLKGQIGKASGKKKETMVARIQEIEAALARTLPADRKEDWKQLESELGKLETRGRKTMITEAKPPREMRILPRGNWQDDSGEIVLPAVPEFLGAISSESEALTRLDLANWLVDPEEGVGGLTARVFANRFWYLFFGTGISRSLEDFGGQGEPPVNPELLDQLAISFYENGWDVKSLIRTLVTSRAYRQASLPRPELTDRDPYHQLVARQDRYRLPAEFLRDNALAVSGLIQLSTQFDQVSLQGQPSARPYQPKGYFRHLNFPTRTYQHDKDASQYRRGVYVHWQRMFLHPMMKAMDAPSREECTAERPRSNTPNAALVLLNDPTFVEAARALAERALAEAGKSNEERIEFLFLETVSRSPKEKELRLLTNLLELTISEYESNPELANRLHETGMHANNSEVDPTNLAGWTALARAVLNLSEFTTRN